MTLAEAAQVAAIVSAVVVSIGLYLNLKRRA